VFRYSCDLGNLSSPLASTPTQSKLTINTSVATSGRWDGSHFCSFRNPCTSSLYPASSERVPMGATLRQPMLQKINLSAFRLKPFWVLSGGFWLLTCRIPSFGFNCGTKGDLPGTTICAVRWCRLMLTLWLPLTAATVTLTQNADGFAYTPATILVFALKFKPFVAEADSYPISSRPLKSATLNLFSCASRRFHQLPIIKSHQIVVAPAQHFTRKAIPFAMVGIIGLSIKRRTLMLWDWDTLLGHWKYLALLKHNTGLLWSSS